MSIYKRPGSSSYQVEFELLGVSCRKSAHTTSRREAEKFEAKCREEIYKHHALGGNGLLGATWDDALRRWFLEKSSKKSLRRDTCIAAFYTQRVGGRAMASIDEACVSGLVADTLSEKHATGTRNRYLAWLRSFLRRCHAWRMLGFVPRVESLVQRRRDIAPITGAEVASLLQRLPQHQRAIAGFALSTGLRRGNVLRLRWDAVDLAGGVVRVASSEHKSGRSRSIPLCTDARRILESQVGQHPEYVFADHRGHAPIGSLKTGWLKAVRDAGLPGFRFHDLRHTWASWHTQNGTPPIVLKELGGWQSLKMLEHYSHLAPQHLAEWAGNHRKE